MNTPAQFPATEIIIAGGQKQLTPVSLDENQSLQSLQSHNDGVGVFTVDSHAGVTEETVQALQATLSSTQPTPESTESSFEQVGDTCTFLDDGKSLGEMIDENPDTLGGLQWVLDLPRVQKNKEDPCRRTITLAQEGSETKTTSKTFTQQEEWAEQKNRSICTLRQMLALYLSAKNAGKTLSSCWMRVSDQYGSRSRFIVKFDADGVHVFISWDGNADSGIGLASSARKSSES